MRSILERVNSVKGALGAMLLAGAAVALIPDTASAQRRGGPRGGGVAVGPRGGVAVGIGPVGVRVAPNGAVGVGVGNYGYRPYGYGYRGYGYRGGWYGTPGYRAGYYSPAYYSAPVVIPSTTIAPAATTVPAQSDTGLAITDVHDGGARQAGLQRGDIILGVDGSRTQSFNDLRAALSAGRDTVAMDVFSPSTEKRSNVNVNVDNTTIGVSVIETPVSIQ